jgi:hypothetical protein
MSNHAVSSDPGKGILAREKGIFLLCHTVSFDSGKGRVENGNLELQSQPAVERRLTG